MKAIEVKDLSKTFKTKIKEKGLKGSFKSLFKSNEMRAIQLIKFWLDYKVNNKNKR